MLRKVTLLACLLAPLAGQAQSLTITAPGPYGKADCVAAGDSNDPIITLAWTVVPTTTPTATSTYQVKAFTTGTCASDAVASNVVSQATIAWTSGNTGTYPGTSGDPVLHLSGLLTKATGSAAAAAAACAATTDVTITVCVQVLNGSTIAGAVSNTVKIQLSPPPVPTSVSVSPGQNALLVSWAAGTSNTVTTSTYRVTARPVTTDVAACTPIPDPLTVACLGAVVAEASTSGKSARLTGLTTSVPYGVEVYAISDGGNSSAASSPPKLGTPIDVVDFWDKYQDMSGGTAEQGGCGGGPAGLLSILAVAGLVRSLRRRS